MQLKVNETKNRLKKIRYDTIIFFENVVWYIKVFFMSELQKYDAAVNPSTSPEVLKNLAKIASGWFLSRDLAKNPSTPAETLKMLAEDDDVVVRRAIAQNPSTPAETLIKLADYSICQKVTKHPSTLEAALAYLQQHTIREHIAKHSNTPIVTLVKLLEDESKLVRFNVENHPTYLQHRAEQDGVCEVGQLMPVEWLKEMYSN